MPPDTGHIAASDESGSLTDDHIIRLIKLKSNHMSTVNYCQSCSMPLDKDEILGTEKDGSKSHEYCKYCYANGSFTNPNMKLSDMKVIVKTQLEKMHSPASVIEKAVDTLPKLKRWQSRLMPS